jgi:hypothetical protein
MVLPAGFLYTRQITVVGQFLKTNATKTKVTHVAMVATTTPTPIYFSSAEFGLTLCFYN